MSTITAVAESHTRSDAVPSIRLMPLSNSLSYLQEQQNISATQLTDEHELRRDNENSEYDKTEGWPVVAAGSALFFVYLGLTYSYGIVQLHLVERKLANVSTLSFIGSLSACITPLLSILVARLIGRIGYRATAFLGSFILGLGELTASWSTKSVPAMFMTQGLLFGIGASMCFLPAATAPSLWFKRKRGLATGVVYGGAGIGSAVIALSLDRLIEAVNLENTLRILGVAAWLVCIPASFFLREPKGRVRATATMQWNLFRSFKFCMMLVMGAIGTFPLFVPPFLLPLYVNSIGLSNRTGAIILATWNLAPAFGRIIMGLGADNFLGPVNSLLISLFVIGSSSLALWPFSSSLGPLIWFAILNGAGSGGFFSLMPVVTGALFGDRVFANAMSLLVTSWTFGYFMGAPIAGYLLEAYGGQDGGLTAFRPAIYFAGSLTLASAGLVLTVRLLIERRIFARV